MYPMAISPKAIKPHSMPKVVENIKKPTIQMLTIIPLNTPPAIPSATPMEA